MGRLERHIEKMGKKTIPPPQKSPAEEEREKINFGNPQKKKKHEQGEANRVHRKGQNQKTKKKNTTPKNKKNKTKQPHTKQERKEHHTWGSFVVDTGWLVRTYPATGKGGEEKHNSACDPARENQHTGTRTSSGQKKRTWRQWGEGTTVNTQLSGKKTKSSH